MRTTSVPSLACRMWWLTPLLMMVGCGVTVPSERPTSVPETPLTDVSVKAPVARLTNGLAVVRVPGHPGSLRALLVVAAGPADDPTGEAGLTEMAVRMALEGTDRSPDAGPSDRVRALAGDIDVVGDGSVSGWVVSGPEQAASGLLNALTDVVMEPSFPATRIAALATRTRESVELRDNGIIMTAIAVASGVALGRGKPLRLQATSPELGRLNRETIVRHWARLIDPRRMALVVAGGGAEVDRALARSSERLAGLKPPKVAASSGFAACQPSRVSTHLVMNPGSGVDNVFTLIALPAPGRGEPARAQLETALAALATTPTGVVARKLGPERAYHAVPRLLDLGYANGKGAAILLMRVSGPRRVALRELFVVLELLVRFGKEPPAGEMLKSAQHNAASKRAHAMEGPVASLVELAAAALYPVSAAAAAKVNWEAAVSDIFDASSLVVVGVGPVELAPLFKRIGPLSVWNSVGRFVGGEKAPGCKQRAL